jgi:hypothetical protein
LLRPQEEEEDDDDDERRVGSQIEDEPGGWKTGVRFKDITRDKYA